MNGKCIIIGAGDFDEISIKKDFDDFVIVADGGLKNAEKISLCPDLIIGDFDSLGYEPHFENMIKLPVKKDVTDTAAAIEIGIKKGCKKFEIYGGTGGREDHTIANIQNMINLVIRGFEAKIISNKQVFTAIYNNSMSFNEDNKGYISVFSYSEISKGVTIRNLKYCIDDAILRSDNPLGVSNEFVGKVSEIKVDNGTLLIIYDRSK